MVKHCLDIEVFVHSLLFQVSWREPLSVSTTNPAMLRGMLRSLGKCWLTQRYVLTGAGSSPTICLVVARSKFDDGRVHYASRVLAA